ncbi:hypothetical protein PtA15_18A141 [Puccinia triticina]|uniref:Uncharacterized protein n=1 Tax=Puccinia triticina TaxID=208348 RepID=A0ABY7D8I0_9BASI|nr:uncharacterized protein PtA15_18A141 [Puccinia triticina]WAQ93084.1 hypothetical protein PtA15_18A141 [Puccinia triticina]
MSGNTDQERLLDTWIKCNKLAQHTTWKPRQRAMLIGLAKELQADYKNSDDEASPTQAPDQQSPINSLSATVQEPRGPAQQPSLPDKGLTHPALEPSRPVEHCRFKQPSGQAKQPSRLAEQPSFLAKQPLFPAQQPSFPAEQPSGQEGSGSSFWANIPAQLPVPQNMYPRFQQFVDTEGLLASLEENFRQTNKQERRPTVQVAPAPINRLEPTLAVNHHKRRPDLGQPRIYETTSQPTRYCLPNVRLEGIPDCPQLKSKKQRVEDTNSDTNAENGEGNDTIAALPPPPAVQKNYIKPLNTSKTASVNQFFTPHPMTAPKNLTSESMAGLTIKRNTNPTSNRTPSAPNRRPQGEPIPTQPTPDSPPRAARDASVELFLPAPLMPLEVAQDMKNKLARGINWSFKSADTALENIAYILTHLPGMISGHEVMPKEFSDQVWKDIGTTSQACRSVEILKTRGEVLLITSDMVNMQQINAYKSNTKEKNVHTLLANLASHFNPTSKAYSRIDPSLREFSASQQREGGGPPWKLLPTDHTGLHTALLSFQKTYQNLAQTNPNKTEGEAHLLSQFFTGAIAGLGYLCLITDHKQPQHKKLAGWMNQNPPQQLQMLAGLIVFGPKAVLTSNKTGSVITIANASALLTAGANVLKQKVDNGGSFTMDHNTFDNLQLYFLDFLRSLGFDKIGNLGRLERRGLRAAACAPGFGAAAFALVCFDVLDSCLHF